MKLQIMINQAQELIDNDDYEKAYVLLSEAYTNTPNDPELIEKLAMCAQTLEKEQEALSLWEKLSEIDPENLVAYSELQDKYLHINKYKYYLTRAKVKVMQGNLGQAVSDYKKAVDNTSEENEIIDARILMAKSYEALHKVNKAIDEYYKILDHRHDLAIVLKLAELCAIDDKHAAINVLKRGIEYFPDESMLKEFLAKCLIETNQLDEALKYTSSDQTKAKIYLMQNENEKAIKILENTEDQTSVEYLLLMAEYYFNKKDFDNCESFIEQYKEKEPLSPLVYQMLALIEEEKSNLLAAHKYWGKYYSLKNDSDMALSEYMLAHNFDNKDADIIKEIIRLNENLNNTTSLMEFYEKLLEAEPTNYTALEKLGDFYYEMQEYRNAIAYYEQLVGNNRSKYEVLLKLGKSYEKIKNNVLAKEFYNKYLDKAPVTPETAALKSKLDSMSNESVGEDEGFLEKILKFFSK